MDREEDPNRPFSVARVAVWALGIIALVAVMGLISTAFISGEVDPNVSSRLGNAVGVAVGGLVAVAAGRTN